MSGVFEGDEWQHAPEPCSAIHLRQRTRAEQQAWIDNEYAMGRIDRDQWEVQTATISTLRADGSFQPTTR